MTERVFRAATWYRAMSALAMLAFVMAGAAAVLTATASWQRLTGAASIAFGVAGFLDVLLSRIVLAEDAIHVISLVRKRRYARGDFESAKVDGGAVCLKKRDGGWLILPDTGANALRVRNTVDAWIRRNEK